jgi:phage/conjugal plasmid C-4 type zinc finger TraR family protein
LEQIMAKLNKKPAAKKTTKKNAPPRDKSLGRKTPKPEPASVATARKANVSDSASEAKIPKVKLSAHDRKHYETLLLTLRDRLLDGINFLATNNLRNSQKESSGDISSYSTHMADAGTDAFDREFALSLVSNEQDALYEVTEALKRLENQTYSICEMCGKTIPKARLEVIPFARLCIKCQETSEKENRNPRRQTQQLFPQFQETEDVEADADEEKESA